MQLETIEGVLFGVVFPLRPTTA